MRLEFFDANARIGKVPNPHYGMFSRADELLRQMDTFGVAEAMVFHSATIRLDWRLGNEALLKEVACHDRLHPAWTVGHQYTGQMPSGEKLAEQMLEHGAKMARLFFGIWGSSSEYMPWAYEDLLRGLETYRIPAMIEWETRSPDWNALADICGRFPDLPVILTHSKLTQWERDWYPLLARYPNFHIEVSGYQGWRGLEAICRLYGSRQLLFGTRAPMYQIGQTMSMVARMLRPVAERQDISSGNLRRLLAHVGEKASSPEPPQETERPRAKLSPSPAKVSEDKYISRCGTDDPLRDVCVIDGHCHVGEWMGMFSIERHIEGLLEVCDAVGIDKICVNYCNLPEMAQGNNVVAKCMERYAERVVGICYINYFEGGPAQRAELKRCFDDLGFLGIKIGNFHEHYPQTQTCFELEDPLQPTWEFAQDRGASILCHGIVTYELAQRYPGANFIVAHGSGVPAFCIKLAELPNTYCDMSATTMLAGTLELLCSKIGADRILYGSDMPASDPGQRLGMVMAAQISEAQKELILGRNMQKLLDNVVCRR